MCDHCTTAFILLYYQHAKTSIPAKKSQTRPDAWIPRAHENLGWAESAPPPDAGRPKAYLDLAIMLPRKNRIPRTDIPLLLRRGSRVREDGVELVFRKTTGIPRFAFVVPKKIDKRATARNRIRRVLSEAVRRHLPQIRMCEGIIIVRAKEIAGGALDVVLTKAGLL